MSWWNHSIVVKMEVENVKDAPNFTVKAFVGDPGDREKFVIKKVWFENVLE